MVESSSFFLEILSSSSNLMVCRTNIIEAHTQVQNLMKSEYSPEDMQNVNMVSIQDLQAQLDNLM